jgi:CheY-like chemotaxis protein
VSRRQILQPQILDLNVKIADIEKMLRGILGEDVELKVKLGSPLGFVRADESQMEQVLLNLVVNARDAMPQGGRLTIETTTVDIDDAFVEHHVGIRPGPHVLLTVSDTGEGMDEETLEHIFEPFFTTKAKGKGTGLGLATVYGIVQQSNGNVWVYSEPGQGTTFKIYLPQIDRSRHRSGDDDAAGKEKKGSETILVIEDENTVRIVTVSNLRKAGYNVLAASDGEEALRIASEHKGPIALVLTDVVMPRMNGPEVLKRLQEKFPTIKGVYMSGHADDALAHHGVIEEGLAFIEKPFTRDELGKRIREVLDG